METNTFGGKTHKRTKPFRIAKGITTPPTRQYVLLVIAVFAISLLSVSDYSFWTDETWRVFPAIGCDFAEMMQVALEISQPGYFIFLRIWTGFVGGAEWAVRASNLLFMPLSLLYCLKILKANNLSILYSLLFFIHPMYVYYMNDASPYMLYYAFGFMFVYYVFYADEFNSISNIFKINAIYLLGVFVGFIWLFVYLCG